MNKPQRKQLNVALNQLSDIQSALEIVYDLCAEYGDDAPSENFTCLYEGMETCSMLMTLNSIYCLIDNVRGDEIDKFDALSEGRQSTKKGQELQHTPVQLEYALEAIAAAITSLGPVGNKWTHETMMEMLDEVIEHLVTAQDHIDDVQN